ncbi:hypothetical protein ACUL41_17470 [Virgibacillus natechei]
MDNRKLLGTIIAVLLLLGIGLLIGYLASLIGASPMGLVENIRRIML